MKQRTITGRRALAAVLLALCTLSTASALGASLESAVSADCFLFVKAANVKDLMEKQKQTHLGRLWYSPEMKPFVSRLTNECDKLFDLIKQESGIDVAEAAAIPQGEIMLAVGMIPNQDEPYIHLAANVEGKEDAVNGLLEKLQGVLEKEQMERSTQGALTVYSKNDRPGQQVCYTIKEGTFVFGNDPGTLNQFVNGLSGGVDSPISELESFQAFRSQSGGPGDIEAFVNLSKIVSLVLQEAPPQAANVVQSLGLDQFDTAGVSYSVQKGDYDAIGNVIVSTRGETPIFNLFNLPAKATRPQQWVPESASGYSTFNWDLDLFYNTLSGIVDGFMPGGMQMIDIQVSQFPSVDNPFITSIKDGIIGPLGNRLTTVSDLGENNGKTVSRTLVAWELDQPAKLQRLLENVLALVGQIFEPKEIKGVTVYTFNLGDLIAMRAPNQDAMIPVGVVGFTVAKGHLLIASHVELLDKVLNAQGAGLGESADFRRLAQLFPPQTSGFSYTKGSAQGKLAWDFFKSGQGEKLLRQMIASVEDDDAAELLSGFASAIGGDNLPEFTEVQKYFASSAGYTLMNDRGLRLVQFTLK